jgi:hypothetical protein
MKRKMPLMILCGVILLGCDSRKTDAIDLEFEPEASVKVKGCPARFEDSNWVNLSQKSLDENVHEAAVAVNSQGLVEKIGPPDQAYVRAGVRKQIWSYGTTRRTRTTDCDGSIKESYNTEYYLLEIESGLSNGKIETCRVARRVYESEKPVFDPKDANGLLGFYSKDTECATWLKEQGL